MFFLFFTYVQYFVLYTLWLILFIFTGLERLPPIRFSPQIWDALDPILQKLSDSMHMIENMLRRQSRARVGIIATTFLQERTSRTEFSFFGANLFVKFDWKHPHPIIVFGKRSLYICFLLFGIISNFQYVVIFPANRFVNVLLLFALGFMLSETIMQICCMVDELSILQIGDLMPVRFYIGRFDDGRETYEATPYSWAQSAIYAGLIQDIAVNYDNIEAIATCTNRAVRPDAFPGHGTELFETRANTQKLLEEMAKLRSKAFATNECVNQIREDGGPSRERRNIRMKIEELKNVNERAIHSVRNGFDETFLPQPPPAYNDLDFDPQDPGVQPDDASDNDPDIELAGYLLETDQSTSSYIPAVQADDPAIVEVTPHEVTIYRDESMCQGLVRCCSQFTTDQELCISLLVGLSYIRKGHAEARALRRRLAERNPMTVQQFIDSFENDLLDETTSDSD